MYMLILDKVPETHGHVYLFILYVWFSAEEKVVYTQIQEQFFKGINGEFL